MAPRHERPRPSLSPRISARSFQEEEEDMMSSMRRYRPRSRGKLAGAWHATAIAMVVVALGATASAAAANVNIVRQGEPPAKVPPGTTYFKTIQGAVNASTSGDYVLIEPGTYYEAVKVTSAQSGIWIRGMNRNSVLLDGQSKPGNGIEIYKANNVWVDNLTVRNFDTGCENCGNCTLGSRLGRGKVTPGTPLLGRPIRPSQKPHQPSDPFTGFCGILRTSCQFPVRKWWHHVCENG